MPEVSVPSDETTTLLSGCGGTSYTLEVREPSGADLRVATSPGDVVQGEEITANRVVTLDVPTGANEVYAKAYNTGGSPATVYVNRREGDALAVERDAPTVIDAIRDSITVQTTASSGSLYPKLSTFEVTGNYSHQFDPSWNFIGEIGITIISAEAAIEISAADGDSDQMPIQSPIVFDQTEVDSFKLHDPNSNNPRIAGWYAGVDT